MLFLESNKTMFYLPVDVANTLLVNHVRFVCVFSLFCIRYLFFLASVITNWYKEL